jgi:hypothetical protein
MLLNAALILYKCQSAFALFIHIFPLNFCLLVLHIIVECLSEALYDLGPQCHQGRVPCSHRHTRVAPTVLPTFLDVTWRILSIRLLVTLFVTGIVVEVWLQPVFDRECVYLLEGFSSDNDGLKHENHAAMHLTVLSQV